MDGNLELLLNMIYPKLYYMLSYKECRKLMACNGIDLINECDNTVHLIVNNFLHNESEIYKQFIYEGIQVKTNMALYIIISLKEYIMSVDECTSLAYQG